MDNLRKYIKKVLKESFVKNDTSILSGIDSFPESIKNTLDEYSKYFVPKFDWNEKQDEFIDNPQGFTIWLQGYKYNGLLKNINNVITKITEDMILIKRKEIAGAKLKAFEELIIPSLGNEVVGKQLTKFEEYVLMNPDATLKSIEDGFREAKNIIDADGSINPLKIQLSTIFTGGDINIPAFENFVNKNPEYQGVFNDWNKLQEDYMALFLKPLNAYRDSTSIDKMRELRNFLIDFRKKL